MNIFQVSKPENIALENQAKFIQERLINTEDNLASLCSAFSNYTSRTAKMRDAGDHLASVLHEFANQESFNVTLRRGLERLAENLASVGDARDCSTVELEQKVVKPLVGCGNQCKNAKGKMKNIIEAKRKEMNKRRQLIKMKRKFPSSSRTIMKAEGNLIEASSEVSIKQLALEDHVQVFERKKLADLKKALIDFINAELAYHVDAVHLYSRAYHDLCEFNVEQDFKEFKDVLKQPSTSLRLDELKPISPGNVIGGPVSPKHEVSQTSQKLASAPESENFSDEDETSYSESDGTSEH